MSERSGEEVDATDAAYQEIGKGLLDEEMGPSSAMAHLYRGEIHRMKFWRERLDRTTNWAVLIISAIITWAFGDPSVPHYIILIGVGTLALFTVMEARRYRAYEIWRSRVRTIQENVIAPGLDPATDPIDPEWRQRLSRDYRAPALKISAEEAIAHRLRRVYFPLFLVLLAAWIARTTAFSLERFLNAAGIGGVSGAVVVVGVGLFYLLLAVVALRPRVWHAKGELRSENLRS